MAGYPPPPGSGYPYGAAGGYGAPAPYGQKPPKEGKTSASDPYHGGPPPQQQPYGGYGGGGYGAPAPPYGQKPPKEGKASSGSDPYHGGPPPQQQPYGGYGAPPAGQQQPYGAPPPSSYGGGGGYGSPFAALVPSAFPPGTDPNIVACFQAADRDGSGMIDDKELQSALSGYSGFSLRTVHLLMYLFTNTNVRKIGPKEFTSVFYSLQNWRGIFDRFDRDRSGKIDAPELRDALLDLGYSVSPTVLDLLVSKFDKTGGKNKAVEYDNFIECCLTVKGLTEKFKEKDMAYSGSATFGYEAFMLTVLPFLIA
ncbi:calcium-binding protein CBP-like [Lolium rigidum]|uniref:calcium-binding protein CBP-like n=1 Tax=Lolium rigidum TaxID=89674 RepID=UPI001F5DC034|nr:calcium-binding protein CBP-like [Lolium rigidum]